MLATAKADPLLTLHYNPDDAWHGELRVEARYAGFSGQASAWFKTEALQQFVEPLKLFLPALLEPTRLQGGYFSDSTTSGAPVETHIGISIGQRGSKGRYWVEAELTEPDDAILQQSATVRFIVEPAALLRFATEIDSMLIGGGRVTLPASGGSDPDPNAMTAPCAIERPYSPLFLALREKCTALIEQMDKEAVDRIRVAVNDEAAAAWQVHPAHEIMAQVDWEHGCLNLAWAEWNGHNWSEGDPAGAEWSPDYPLDLALLKQSALSAAHPRAWFESYALYVLSVAQDYLDEVISDGETDEIHYYRHLIFAHGTARHSKPAWVGHVVFKHDDRHQQQGSQA